ncbi:MAG: hypothetical protein LRZ99_06790 [Desulfotomaculum sp.]|nr:hypothetical protein [Desulfotomaculum sp.]MCL0081024.1 hypothetical protein [Peptococcaceae bacterium]
MTNKLGIMDTTIVDKLAGELEQAGFGSSAAFKFKLDMVDFINFLRSRLDKDLNQADEEDVIKFKDQLRTDISFLDLIDRRAENARIGLRQLKAIYKE